MTLDGELVIRAFVADAPDDDRARLTKALSASGFRVEARSSSARHLLLSVNKRRPNVLLVSVHLPGLDRASWRALVGAVDPAPVLALVDDAADEVLLDVLWAGCRGAVLRDKPENAPAAVRAALAGDVAVPRETTTFLVSTVIRQRQLLLGDGPVSLLTARERQVYRLMQEGRSTNEIADELVVAPVTVRSHVAAIVRKLQVEDRLAAVELTGNFGRTLENR